MHTFRVAMTGDFLNVDGELAYITWSAGREIPLGTDTFVVRNGKIVAQTVAAYTASTP